MFGINNNNRESLVSIKHEEQIKETERAQHNQPEERRYKKQWCFIVRRRRYREQR